MILAKVTEMCDLDQCLFRNPGAFGGQLKQNPESELPAMLPSRFGDQCVYCGVA